MKHDNPHELRGGTPFGPRPTRGRPRRWMAATTPPVTSAVVGTLAWRQRLVIYWKGGTTWKKEHRRFSGF